IEVIRVQHANIFGPRHGDPFVHRVGLAAIGLRDPSEMRMRVGLFTQDLDGAVGRPAIDHNVLDARAVLRRDGLDASANKSFTVENRGDDACLGADSILPVLFSLPTPTLTNILASPTALGAENCAGPLFKHRGSSIQLSRLTGSPFAEPFAEVDRNPQEEG